MARFLACSFFITSSLTITLLLINVVQGGDYGKIKCVGKTKMPEAKLLGTFIKAKCDIPKDSSDAALGAAVRCVYVYVKAFTPPSTFHKAVAEKEIGGAFPKKYQDGLKVKLGACIDKYGKTAKSAKEDKSGKSWAGMYNCFNDWYTNQLCE